MDRGGVMERKDYFIGYMEDLADKATKTGCATSRFLTPAEARRIAEYFKFKRVKLLFDGGYDSAERVLVSCDKDNIASAKKQFKHRLNFQKLQMTSY